MVSVLEELRKYNSNLFYLDDVDKIYAIRFFGATDETIKDIIANKSEIRPFLVRREMELNNQRISGTHAYHLVLLNGDRVNIPVWQ